MTQRVIRRELTDWIFLGEDCDEDTGIVDHSFDLRRDFLRFCMIRRLEYQAQWAERLQKTQNGLNASFVLGREALCYERLDRFGHLLPLINGKAAVTCLAS